MPSMKSINGIDRMAETFRLLGDTTRLIVLQLLLDGSEKNVGTLAAEARQSQPNVSKHLKHLAQAGILSRRKTGLQVYYRLADSRVVRIWRVLGDTSSANGRSHGKNARRANRSRGR